MEKNRAVVGLLLLTLVVIVGLFYVQASLRRASAPPRPGPTPSLEARLDLALDELKRAETLFRDGTVTEQDYIRASLEAELLRRQIATAKAEAEVEFSQKTLEAELLRKQIATAQAEVELKRRELDTLILRSPIEGLPTRRSTDY